MNSSTHFQSSVDIPNVLKKSFANSFNPLKPSLALAHYVYQIMRRSEGTAIVRLRSMREALSLYVESVDS